MKSRIRELKKLKKKLDIIISDKGNLLEKREKAERISEKIEIRLSDQDKEDILGEETLKLFYGIDDHEDSFDGDMFRQEPYDPAYEPDYYQY